MVALQPGLLACPTATLRARAQQLAIGLSSAPAEAATGGAATPRHPRSAPGLPPAVQPAPPQLLRPRSAGARSGFTPPPGAANSAIPPLERPTPTAHAQTRTAAQAPAAVTPSVAEHGGAGGGAGNAVDHASAPPSVSVTEAIALIARQPALMQVPLQRLCGRCHELAAMLGVTPREACVCLTRMPPDDLDRLVQAPLGALRSAWLKLAFAMANLDLQQQPWPQQQLLGQPVGHGGGGYAGIGGHEGGGDEDADQDSDAQREAQRGPQHDGYSARAQPQEGQQQQPHQQPLLFPRSGLAVPPPRPPPSTASRSDADARRMVLLCPQLLMLRAGAVRASALHLRSLLGLSAGATRRLLARSPRLLMLPPRHRIEALAALSQQLRLRGPRDAARLVAQQPGLLKWTPAALHAKCGELGAALGLPPAGIARLCRNQPALLGMSPGSLAEKLRRLEEALRLPGADAARRLALEQPGVLTISSDAVERKLGQLAEALSLGSEDPERRSCSSSERGGGTRARRQAGLAQRSSARVGGGGAAGGGDGGLAAARRLAAAEPTLLTMDVKELPRRLVALEEELGAASLAEAMYAVMACPRLLVVQRAALRHRLQELAWGLEAPAAAVRALVRRHPEALFVPLEELQAGLEAAEAAGAGQELRGRRRMAALLEHLAREPGDWLGGVFSEAP